MSPTTLSREEWLALRDRAEDMMRCSPSGTPEFMEACQVFERACWELGEHWNQPAGSVSGVPDPDGNT